MKLLSNRAGPRRYTGVYGRGVGGRGSGWHDGGWAFAANGSGDLVEDGEIWAQDPNRPRGQVVRCFYPRPSAAVRAAWETRRSDGGLLDLCKRAAPVSRIDKHCSSRVRLSKRARRAQGTEWEQPAWRQGSGRGVRCGIGCSGRALWHGNRHSTSPLGLAVRVACGRAK